MCLNSLFGFSDSSAISVELITQIAFPNMSATPNISKKDPSTDRFCFLYDCFFGLQLGPAWIELSSVKQQSKFSIILRAVHLVQKN